MHDEMLYFKTIRQVFNFRKCCSLNIIEIELSYSQRDNIITDTCFKWKIIKGNLIHIQTVTYLVCLQHEAEH